MVMVRASSSIILRLVFIFISFLLLASHSAGQDYNDEPNQEYEQDNLYHDYAAKQQQKEVDKNGGAAGGWIQPALVGTVGWFAGGKIHCRRLKKKLQTKHMKEQKEIYQQYYNDVYALQQENLKLSATLEKYQKAGRA